MLLSLSHGFCSPVSGTCRTHFPHSIRHCGDGSVGAAPLLYSVCFNIMISSMVQSDLASGGVSSIRPNRASRRRLGHRHQLLNLLVERMALGDDLIDDAEGSGILRRQKIVAVERLIDRLIGLPGVAHIDVV